MLVEAVVRTESAFDPTAMSRKGAAGLMQLMPGTASALGVLDRFDPRESIRGGVRHLRYLLDRYQGQVATALAAYNAGERAVDAHGGIPPYRETEQYVQRVLRLSGLTDVSAQPSQMLYRYPGPGDATTYSNLPPGPPGKDLRGDDAPPGEDLAQAIRAVSCRIQGGQIVFRAVLHRQPRILLLGRRDCFTPPCPPQAVWTPARPLSPGAPSYTVTALARLERTDRLLALKDVKIRVVGPGQPRELLTTLTVAGYLLPAVGT